jgi:thiol-disulfide isomerase/thioredoxin
MSNNRTRNLAAAQKGRETGRARTRPSSAASTKPAKRAGARTNPSGTSANRRYAEREARKQQLALDAKRTRNRRYAIFTIALVICIVAVLVIVKVTGGGSGSGSGIVDQSSPPAGTPIPAATLAKVASVPVSTLTAAPTSGILQTPQVVANPVLVANGKPEILYIGAEWCPHCAAERWALYLALSKFGTFSPAPGRIHSANRDGSVPTLTFYGTRYSSPYLSLMPVEVYTNHPTGNGYTTLQTPTRSQLQLWQNTNGGTFPFVDLGGKQVLAGAQYSFADLQNLSFSEVAGQVGDNSTTIGANIDASAAQLVKTICGSLTHGQPAAVCSP